MAILERMAGKALIDFFKVASNTVSSAAKEKTLSAIAGMQNPTGIFAAMAAHPETTANLVGAATPLVASGGIAAAGYLGNKLLGGRNSREQVSSGAQRQALYSQQPFVPGTLPFTNAQASELMLDQMKMQHQLQVIQARQSASSGQGSLYSDPGLGNVYDIASKIYA